MAIQIKFDEAHNPIEPTIVLAARSGKKLGKLCAQNIVLKASMSGDDISFKVDKAECGDLWSQITDFKLIWIREWNKWFEIYVETDDTVRMIKSVTAVSLGKAELSQINLYDKEINTEDDISRDDYNPTVFYSPTDPSASLLDRILEKAPHYSIGHVDNSLCNIQRTFSFDEKNIYDALTEIAEEIECLIDIDCSTDTDGTLVRRINAYDLKQVCVECGERGDLTGTCSKCGGKNILPGYGDDTTIYVSTENLADNISYSTDTGSVKNCFKLEAGDDLMAAAIVGCNPTGSGYIWYISDETKKDMSAELVTKLAKYDKDYNHYMKEHVVSVPDSVLTKYNALIDKYRIYTSDYRHAVKEIVGYPALMERYFDTIDFGLYLSDKLMPDIKIAETNAQEQVDKIITYLTDPVAVKDIENCSSSTADSAVLGVAKAVCDTRYKIRITESSFSNNVWRGIIEATNEADESDVYTSPRFACIVNDNYGDYVKQKILKSMKKTFDDAVSLQNMFALKDDKFSEELVKYCLSRLIAFHDACQTCVDILIEQGVADPNKWKYREDDMYNGVYLPYYNKLKLIEKEMKLREDEISVVCGDENATGMQTILRSAKDSIQSILNFETYLSGKLYKELSSYRREDTYKNSNYISDGLDNAELFQTAMSFLEIAKADIIKSSTLQHKIDATLKNLLAIPEFSPIVDHFEIGNWMRIRVDGKLCKLRLIGYEIDFDNFGDISVEFSDVVSSGDTVSDVESVISQASSIASSYDVVARQAKKGDKSNSELNNWVDRGLSLTKLKIVDSADNQNISWDSHGLLCKEYLPTLGSYDDRQLKIISRGLYLTDDDWKTSKAGIGDFTYWNPKTGKMEESYGLIADAIVGNIVLSEEVGIYNQNNSMTMNQDGLTITAFKENGKQAVVFNVRKKVVDDDGNESYQDELYLDDDGNLVINGTVRINSTQGSSPSTIDGLGKNINDIQDRIDGFNGLYLYIRYSENSNGDNMTEAPTTDTTYIGTCNTDDKVAPSDPLRYVWVKFKGERGEQGVQGIQGINGKNSYLYIRYSNDGKSFTNNGGTTIGDWIGTCITESAVPPVEFSSYTWSRFHGADGLNTAAIVLYKRASSTPEKPTRDVTYTFASGEITDADGWTCSIQDGNDPCYAIHATACATASTDVIKSTEWSDPVIVARNGSDGKNGFNGSNGYNTAIVYLYKRSYSATSVDWNTELIYTFSTGKLTPTPSGWSQTIPSGIAPIYVTTACARNNIDTDKIGYSEWSTPVLLAQNGSNGKNGTSAYFYIRYSDNSDGSDFYTSPKSSTAYIGVCSTATSEAPTDKSKYTWSKFRGEDGIKGPAGADGKSQYIHIKYSNDGLTFTGNGGEDIGEYIGIYVDFEQSDSIDFYTYTWKRITGDVDGIIAEVTSKLQERDDEYNGKFKTIDEQYLGVSKFVDDTINSYRSEIGQYMTFGEDGLTLGAKKDGISESAFKTVIDNAGIYFKENDATVSFIRNRSLYIGNAVIETTMKLGNFFFAPRYDEGSEGSMSIVWEDTI